MLQSTHQHHSQGPCLALSLWSSCPCPEPLCLRIRPAGRHLRKWLSFHPFLTRKHFDHTSHCRPFVVLARRKHHSWLRKYWWIRLTDQYSYETHRWESSIPPSCPDCFPAGTVTVLMDSYLGRGVSRLESNDGTYVNY